MQKAKILLEKINALYKSMSVDENNITAIERDLMLSYLRQFYDIMLQGSSAQMIAPTPETAAPTPPPVKAKPAKPKYKPPRIIEIPDSLKEVAQTTAPPKKTTKTRSKPKPRVITPPKVEPAPPPAPKPKPVVKTPPPPPPPKREPQPVYTPPPAPEPTPQPQTQNAEHDALFEFKAARELSEKLSQRPISDLSKAFSLNDKLLYANELFGRQLVVFNEAVRKVNGMDNFNQAKAYLTQLADKYHWSKKEKVPLAKDFVMLVKRRFS